jgi:galactokinase
MSIIFAYAPGHVDFPGKLPGREMERVYGSRITGGGFGGVIVTPVSQETADSAVKLFASHHREKAGNVCETDLSAVAEDSL